MTTREFSDAFDTLLNSYATQSIYGEQASKAEIVLDEYEKSIFLTKAQEWLVLSLYNGKNIDNESFEETEELRRYLSSLIEEDTLSPITTSNGLPLGVDSRSKFFTLPEDLWFITYEAVDIDNHDCSGNATLTVYPVRQDEYHKIKKNPFRGANDRRALRLDLSNNNIEIISKFNVTKYYVRYLKKLSPIILIDLPNGLSIDGEDTEATCALHESLHKKILDRAVELALYSRGININKENR